MRRPCHGSCRYKEEERHVGQNKFLSAERFGIELLNAKSPFMVKHGEHEPVRVCACFWVCISVYERQAGRQKEVGERKEKRGGNEREGEKKGG